MRPPAFARTLALAGPAPLATWAVAWLARSAARRSAREPGPGPRMWSSHDELPTLLRVMTVARSRRAAERARVAMEALWASERARPLVWASVWREVGSALRGSAYRDRLDPEVTAFLLGPDPGSGCEPRVRLVAGLSIENPRLSGTGRDLASHLLDVARSAPDPDVRGGVRDVVSRTDHPALLTAMEAAFVRGVRRHLSPRSGSPADELWAADGSPTPLLELILANPHLPRTPADERPDPSLAVLAVLRDRPDLLSGFDGWTLVEELINYLTCYDPPPPLADACRRALRALGPGPAREALCWWASQAESDDAEAIAAAVDAGYLPADPSAAPLFLLLTRQWDRYARADPTGDRLYAYVVGLSATGYDSTFAWNGGGAWIASLLDIVEEAGDAGEAALRALRDVGPGPVRDRLCAEAMDGDPVATRIVVEAGHAPSDPRMVPALLFLTGQWDRYDATDPDGSRLAAWAGALPRWDPRRDRLRAAAERAGRPPPCRPVEHPRATSYRPGGTGTAGTGGFTVHGV